MDFVVGPNGVGLFTVAFPTKWNERANNNKQFDDIKYEKGFQYGLCIGNHNSNTILSLEKKTQLASTLTFNDDITSQRYKMNMKTQ